MTEQEQQLLIDENSILFQENEDLQDKSKTQNRTIATLSITHILQTILIGLLIVAWVMK